MKKILLLSAILISFNCFAQQSVYGICHKMASEGYHVEYPLRTHGFEGCLQAFCDLFPENSLVAALRGSGTKPVSQRIVDSLYAKVTLDQKEFAELEARLTPLPSGDSLFVLKIVNYEENTLPGIFFFSTNGTRMVRIRQPEGMNFGIIYDFKLHPQGSDIEIVCEDRPSDWIVLQDDGTLLLKPFARDTLACWVEDPDPSGKTNVRSAPGGKVIGQADRDGILVVYGPRQGWWQLMTGGWIHYSVLAAGTRNYSGEQISLHKEPSADAPVTGIIRRQEITVRPMDITPDGEWVKVKCAFGTGWLESDWLCGNPFTTCP